MSLIEIKNLKKEYENATPLADINANINKGEVITIIGPSGTGKSTLLRCINGLETPTSGQIIVNGVDVTDKKTDMNKVRLNMGMVFQSFNLFPHKMVAENIMMPQMSLLGKNETDSYIEAMAQLKKVGLESKARNYPDELSGGQKQRVAIARALAMHPEILLFDEPTSALDPTMVSEVLSVIRDLADTELTMIIVTHEMRLARHVSDRVFFMTDGVIYEEGSPQQIFDAPQKEATRQFIMRIKNWEYTLNAGGTDMYEMLSRLYAFGLRQFITREKLNNLSLVIEEMSVSSFIPALEASGCGTITLSVQASEGGSDIRLLVGSHDMGDADIFRYKNDKISAAIINKHAARAEDIDGYACFIIT
ncbi:MAG: amino acid ABC transporter ATP-binding protein [Eubacterium sp.]|nr:amino acid ABC transporter ATP-binding protein [Eubacterium sp.]